MPHIPANLLKAVIFDMDGVIIDSEPLHARAAVLALADYGVTLTTEYCYSFIGSTAKHMLEVIRDTYHLPVSLSELVEANARAKAQLVAKEGYPPIPYVRELMEDLSAHGITLAIASSSPYEDILNTVRRLNLEPYLTHIVSGMQVAHPKPAPDIFLAAADALGVQPCECVVIEDSFNGVTAARAAGMAVLGFANPNSGNQDLWKAHSICESFASIDHHFVRTLCQHANGLPATIGETERLILRELSMDDLSALQSICTECNIHLSALVPDAAFTNTSTEADHASMASDFSAYQKYAYGFYGYGLWGVFNKDDNKLIGCCGLQNSTIDHSDELELSYLLAPSKRHQGYAWEAARFVLNYALDELESKRVVAAVAPENTASVHLAEKLGMKPEKGCYYQDTNCILYVYTGAKE